MKVITPGHLYALNDFSGHSIQNTLQFIQKEQDPNGPTGQLKTVMNGTTNEEVLRVLIDRLQFLNGKFPCRENSVALTHIETALLWLDHRTANRVARGVEGKHAA